MGGAGRGEKGWASKDETDKQQAKQAMAGALLEMGETFRSVWEEKAKETGEGRGYKGRKTGRGGNERGGWGGGDGKKTGRSLTKSACGGRK